MVTKDDLVFRQVATLRDGARVLLRPLIADDRQALIDLFIHVPPEETRFMRHNVNDPDLVGAWADNIDYEKVFPLVAVVGERIVGLTTLHFMKGPYKHRAEMRIFLAKDFRRRGLGTRLMQGLFELAKRRNLYLVEVQQVSELVTDIKALQKVGFEVKATFEDFWMLPDGELRDIVFLVLKLRRTEDEF